MTFDADPPPRRDHVAAASPLHNPSYWLAWCECGWQGPLRGHRNEAAVDAETHEATENAA